MTLAPAAAAIAASAAVPAVEPIDALLDAVTALKAQQKQLEQELEPLLEALSKAMDAGELDPAFSHNDWAFTNNPGRLGYDFPLAVQKIEQQLKAARDAAIQQGSATEKRGKPFWTIRAPKAQALPL
ncbi:hypothetical protein [Synechococcus sp. EJ6-Ellesmere]|uniref:hypothetical protein n=1 Tax=Synechococcus sp. EJ6-Ellesmere TaxID=2823734 RepID=UPI0020CFE1E6|nr:hypothetical protein [Synechococcus sp. EJ6-Ellesmere]